MDFFELKGFEQSTAFSGRPDDDANRAPCAPGKMVFATGYKPLACIFVSQALVGSKNKPALERENGQMYFESASLRVIWGARKLFSVIVFCPVLCVFLSCQLAYGV